jgi:ABC-type lipoprotein release transport system permease subunit
MTIFDRMLWVIAFRSLGQHRLRSVVLGGAVAGVTALLVMMTGAFVGIRSTLLVSATTLMSGHVNVAGFYKASASQAAPIVTGYHKVRELIVRDVPELDYVVQRGRGWAKLVSDSGSQQAAIGGIDITNEPGFKKVITVKSGNIEDLAKPNTVLLFEEQAKKLEVKAGDTLTVAAPTFRGTNNTVDVTVAAIAANIGMLSSWNVFMNDKSLRQLYQLNDETTGALQIYLKRIEDVKAVQERLRVTLQREGYEMVDPDPRPYFQKFDAMNREAWTGQRLDVTNWEEETSFVQWILTALTAMATMAIGTLLAIIGVGIMNVMWISIRERTREIGTLRAVGMQRTSVLAMFVAEGFLMGLFGTVSGGLLGALLSSALTAAQISLPKGFQFIFFSERLVISPTLAWVTFSVAFITLAITLISIIPSFLAARLKPITAMSQVG